MPNCCASPQRQFLIRNDGYEPLENDTRATITLPAGVISAPGLTQIRNNLFAIEQNDKEHVNA